MLQYNALMIHILDLWLLIKFDKIFDHVLRADNHMEIAWLFVCDLKCLVHGMVGHKMLREKQLEILFLHFF